MTVWQNPLIKHVQYLRLLKILLFLDEIKTILRFLPDGDYQTIFNGTFAKCILGLDIEIKSGD